MLVWPINEAPAVAQAGHGRAVLACERGIVHRARRRGGWLASDVEQVLDRIARDRASRGVGAPAARSVSTARRRGTGLGVEAAHEGVVVDGAAALRAQASRAASARWLAAGDLGGSVDRSIGIVDWAATNLPGFSRCGLETRSRIEKDHSRSRQSEGVAAQPTKAKRCDSRRILDPTFGANPCQSPCAKCWKPASISDTRHASGNPKMAPYIYGHRNKIHIINLEKTQPLFEEALKFVRQRRVKRGTILMIGTKRRHAT